MADQKLSQLTAATLPLAGTELAYVVQGGAERRTTAAAMAAALPDATTSTAGKLSAADKAKLDSITVDQARIVRWYVRNETGVTIAKGIPVYASGTNGVTPTISPADASTEETAARTLGITQESIAHQDYGWVVEVGPIDGINTSTLTENAIIWLSETTGQITTTRPTQPAHGVVLGYCVKQAAGTAGIIYVKVDNGLELAELHDVLLTGAVAGDVLALASDGLWKKRTLGSAAALNVGTTAGTVAAGDAAAAAIATHVAAADPHTSYLRPAEIVAGTNMSVDTTTTPGSVILNATGGTPGGNSGEAQFNNAGVFGGAAGLTIDPATGRLTLASFLAAASAPSAPASAGFTLYAAPTTGALSWRGANGFIRTLNATGITADRSYQFQDKSGTLAHLDDVFPDLYAVGNYVVPASITTGGGSALVVNTIYLYPFKVERRIRASELAARLTIAVAASSFQLAIYNSISGLPASLLASTADMSGATVTTVTSAIAESDLDSNRLYWFAINANATLSFSTPASTETYASAIIGAPTATIAVGTWNRSFSQTYGTWPDLTGQTTTAAIGTRCPVPLLRVSALL